MTHDTHDSSKEPQKWLKNGPAPICHAVMQWLTQRSDGCNVNDQTMFEALELEALTIGWSN
jgi:hypothetical protein